MKRITKWFRKPHDPKMVVGEFESPFAKFEARYRLPLIIIGSAVGTTALIILPVAIYRSIALTNQFVPLDPSSGIVAGNTQPVNDSAATGGSYLKFTSPPTPTPPPPDPTPTPTPSPTSGCPAFPAFPDANCTGWQHTGVTLSNYTGPATITTAGTVIDSKTINGDIIIKANNVTIKRSKINGTINLGYGDASGVLIEDVEINGGNTTYAGIGSAGFTCRRCNIYGAGQGINGYSFTVEDSYIHDLYGEGAVHSETILGYSGNIAVRHNRLSGNYNSASGNWSPNDGGMSSSVSFYTHGSWGPINNIVFEQNRLNVGGGERDYAGYCLYAGGALLSNGTFQNNIFVRHPQNTAKCGYHGTVVDYPAGAGSTWTNNKFEDGTPL